MINLDPATHTAFCKFNHDDITLLPLDTYFELCVGT
jgi:hypothetical protein